VVKLWAFKYRGLFRTPNRHDKRNNLYTHYGKISRLVNQERILKAARGKKKLSYKGKSTRIV
jgi:hypothetical protein